MIDIVSWPAQFLVLPLKLHGYLFDPASEDGASKGAYLTSYGFRADDPATLKDALLAHAIIENFAGVKVSEWGLKFLFDGPLSAPNGQDATMLTVWQVDAGSSGGTARFITTRPSKDRRPRR